LGAVGVHLRRMNARSRSIDHTADVADPAVVRDPSPRLLSRAARRNPSPLLCVRGESPRREGGGVVQWFAGRLGSNLVVGGLVAVLAACASYPCTLIGCGSHVTVDLSRIGSRYGSLPAIATMCVNGDCQTRTVKLVGSKTSALLDLDLLSFTPSPADPTTREVPVTLTLERAGELLVASHGVMRLTRFAPNGNGCAPTCYSARLRLDGGQLVAVPSSGG
jgi:hypothetical protein